MPLLRIGEDRSMPSPLHLRIREMINAEDPVGLLALGAPEDEYDPQVVDLIKWRQAVTADQVRSTFRKWFEESGDLSDDVAARLAVAITSAVADVSD
jgi:hypothetical protein